ncbi:glutamate receptor ionotropic, delta-1-like [Ciona intestinalis]
MTSKWSENIAHHPTYLYITAINGLSITTLPHETFTQKEYVANGQEMISLKASKSYVPSAACDLANIGVTAIITTATCPVALTIQSLTENLHIPLLQVDEVRCKQQPGNFMFSPKPDTQIVINTLIEYMNSRHIFNAFIICEEDQDTAMAEELTYQINDGKQRRGFPTKFLIRISAPNSTSSWSDEVTKTAYLLADMIESNRLLTMDAVIVFARPENVISLIRTVGNMSNQQMSIIHWVIPNLGFNSRHLAKVKSATARITVIKTFYNTSRPSVNRFIRAWNEDIISSCETCARVEANEIPLTAYYLYDGVLHLSTALINSMLDKTYVSSAPMTCKSQHISQGGEPVMRSLRKLNTTSGLTGLKLAAIGYNKMLNLEVVSKGLGKNKPFQFETTITASGHNGTVIHGISSFSWDVTLKVATLEEAPFVIINRHEKETHFHGFAIDLLSILADSLGFKYEIYEVGDKQYGSVRENGTWSGLIGDVMEGKADITVAAMTITADRETVVDFARRYMDYSVGIAIKKPQISVSLFSFVQPFHYSVWFCILSSLVLVVVFIYILNLVSPNRKENGSNPSSKKEGFKLSSVFWFAYSSLMQQGGDLHKVTVPVRVVVAFWWLFTLFVISSYTANLAAFLTVKRMDSPIRSIRDLANQKDYSYGTVKDTSIFNFIAKRGEETTDTNGLYKIMSHVVQDRSNEVHDAARGFQRAANGHFAFLWDVAVIEYEVINHNSCSLTTVKDSIYDKGYGFALQHGSPYRDPISLKIMELQDKGEIEKLRNKWWPKSGKCVLDKNPPSSDGTELTLNNFTGIFFVLAVGLVLGCVMAMVEICVHLGKGKVYPPVHDEEKDKTSPDIHLILSKKELLHQLVDAVVKEATEYNQSDENTSTLIESNLNQMPCTDVLVRKRSENASFTRSVETVPALNKSSKMRLGSIHNKPMNYYKLLSSPCKPPSADGTSSSSKISDTNISAFNSAMPPCDGLQNNQTQTFPRSIRNDGSILKYQHENRLLEPAGGTEPLDVSHVNSLFKKSSV